MLHISFCSTRILMKKEMTYSKNNKERAIYCHDLMREGGKKKIGQKSLIHNDIVYSKEFLLHSTVYFLWFFCSLGFMN